MTTTIDTRDLQERLVELEEQEFEETLDSDDADELERLRQLSDKVGPEFPHGETMILASDFESYARELAEDIGAIDSDARWPNYCIDWEYAARELRADYSLVVWDGWEYLVRSS